MGLRTDVFDVGCGMSDFGFSRFASSGVREAPLVDWSGKRPRLECGMGNGNGRMGLPVSFWTAPYQSHVWFI